MNAESQIAGELSRLGFDSEALEINGLGGNRAIAFKYTVETGRFKGSVFKVGVAFQESGYPEYPPHFVWVAGLANARLPEHSTRQYGGDRWAAFSVPPSDFWDRLSSSQKNMKTYLNKHFVRFWTQV